MPKNRRKAKNDRTSRSGQTSEAEDSYNDDASVFSNFSSRMSDVVNEVENDIDDLDEDPQEAFEYALLESLEGVMQKSSHRRITSCEAVGNAFIKKYIPDFVHERYMTICSAIERSLKKGSSDEKAAVADLAALLCVQLGAGVACEQVITELKTTLLNIAKVATESSLARAKCCTALGLIFFLGCEELNEIHQLMKVFSNIFSGSYLKGDGSVPNITVEESTIHVAAISSWTLLITLMSSKDVYNMLNDETSFSPSISQLSELMTSKHLEVRISAGEALATVFELGRNCEDDFGESYVPDVVLSLKQLATDSNKYRAKKDRKIQRATFRDIVSFIETDEKPEYKIRFAREQLILDSWARKRQYDSLCGMLGSGMNTHLAENELLRDIFDLGEPIEISEIVVSKAAKFERRLQNAASCKARTINRNRNRDKRSDF